MILKGIETKKGKCLFHFVLVFCKKRERDESYINDLRYLVYEIYFLNCYALFKVNCAINQNYNTFKMSKYALSADSKGSFQNLYAEPDL